MDEDDIYEYDGLVSPDCYGCMHLAQCHGELAVTYNPTV
jgi:hypothetical protein